MFARRPSQLLGWWMANGINTVYLTADYTHHYGHVALPLFGCARPLGGGRDLRRRARRNIWRHVASLIERGAPVTS